MLLSRFCATIREIRDFNREIYGANRESVTLQDSCEYSIDALAAAANGSVIVVSANYRFAPLTAPANGAPPACAPLSRRVRRQAWRLRLSGRARGRGKVRGYFLVFVQLLERYGTLIERYTALIEKVSPCKDRPVLVLATSASRTRCVPFVVSNRYRPLNLQFNSLARHAHA
eukprot:SAG31_NODE_4199_length_3480_cov_4.559302_4_plen_172_part_00